MENNLTGQTIRKIADDPVKSALAVNLVHISDDIPGIKRVKHGKGFIYYYNDKKIANENVLSRIRDLVIPPAWKNVWICPQENGHLQATGMDAKNRKQYLYHPAWKELRGTTKFYRLHAFGKALPTIRKQLRKDLSRRDLSKEKVLATIISLMEQTNIRIGNEVYERLYGSFGLSTLKDNNVKLNGSKMRFVFTGKKGVSHDITLRNKRLANIVLHCREIPGKHLFQYYDENKERQSICSGDVNEYIKRLSGKSFTSKDFRTWSGTVECIRALRESTVKEPHPLKKNIIKAFDQVASCLGNTRSVCKKYYIHPVVISAYENGKLQDYFDQCRRGAKWMDREEKILMKILESKLKR